jgi:hypothetical protein
MSSDDTAMLGGNVFAFPTWLNADAEKDQREAEDGPAPATITESLDAASTRNFADHMRSWAESTISASALALEVSPVQLKRSI